jgi:hypothetical protein
MEMKFLERRTFLQRDNDLIAITNRDKGYLLGGRIASQR